MTLSRSLASLCLPAFCLVGLVNLACTSPQEAVPANETTDLSGEWRAVLSSPGGELPFGIKILATESGYEGWILNADEEAPLSSVSVDGTTVTLDFSWYDSTIKAELHEDHLAGTWSRTYPEHLTQLPFEATRGIQPRFLSLPSATGTDLEISGNWHVTFTDEDGSEPARAELSEQNGVVSGTFLTPTGDYRFLEGSWEQGVLRLSAFDGAHCFLFEARGDELGQLNGDFWSRDTYHATWTALPIDGLAEGTDLEEIPDPWTQAWITNPEGRFRFAFQDLEGNAVSQEDERFHGKVVLVNLFGSWCPNCNDEAPLLATWAREYREAGLEIVGLAYEFTGETERDREMVRRFATRYDIDYTLLLAGTSDKEVAAATVPDLSSLVAYPTTLFVDRTGKVRKVHSGFSGPGTGEHHDALVTEMRSMIESLIAEPVPPVGG